MIHAAFKNVQIFLSVSSTGDIWSVCSFGRKTLYLTQLPNSELQIFSISNILESVFVQREVNICVCLIVQYLLIPYVHFLPLFPFTFSHNILFFNKTILKENNFGKCSFEPKCSQRCYCQGTAKESITLELMLLPNRRQPDMQKHFPENLLLQLITQYAKHCRKSKLC